MNQHDNKDMPILECSVSDEGPNGSVQGKEKSPENSEEFLNDNFRNSNYMLKMMLILRIHIKNYLI